LIHAVIIRQPRLTSQDHLRLPPWALGRQPQ
jgi:hypothetical protein